MSNIALTSQQISYLATAYRTFNLETTGRPHPGLWVGGNFSTVKYCSAYGGAAVVVPTISGYLPYDFYFCKTPYGNSTAVVLTQNLIARQSLQNHQVDSSASAPRTPSSWLMCVLTAVATFVIISPHV